ncbi:MAG: hypothetical protein A3F42_03235 [Gammaproteobacteria bacterium RIFCSPHIGHO2_12_FULL_37_34]|nr:MAG: hypothetical protein A3F42_03235 [Gammaproteobacteria bacterium RIFCSPHIGHO2_12_FULL_37_34]
MNVRPLDPQRIPNNFRLQSYIEEELTKANTIIKSEEHKKFTSNELIDFGLIYLEIGNWDKAKSFYCEALTLEQAKPEYLQDKEVLATVYYISATMKREKNNCLSAIKNYAIAEHLAQSDWLKSNIFRNLGLVYLKMADFEVAAKIFKQGLDFTNQVIALRGSLPAFKNYYGLSLTRAALKNKQDPTEGLKTLEETTLLYGKIFLEKNVSETDQLKSHDFQSHQFHRGMILCEMAEHQDEDKAMSVQDKFQHAEQLLQGALAGRIANKADEQRLGDTCAWLGRIYIGLKQIENAQQYFEKALRYYQTAFSNVPDAKQIKDVQTRLAGLKLFSKTEKITPSLAKLSILTQPPNETNNDANTRYAELRPTSATIG